MKTDIKWEMNLCQSPKLVGIGVTSENVRGVRAYCLPELWSMHLYEYDVHIYLEGYGGLDVHPGCATVVPAGVLQHYHYTGPSNHVYTHYELAATNKTATDLTRVPAVVDLGSQFPYFKQRALKAIKTFARLPERGEAFLWDMLWTLSEANGQLEPQDMQHHEHPAVTAVREYIELHLAEPIGIDHVVKANQLSQSQLSRVFKRETGQTLIGFLRCRRAQTARYLLLNSTMPIKTIAIEVGVPDLQQFNKLVRHFWGKSPRQIRAEN
jgi:AraC-like DNA-binding protein